MESEEPGGGLWVPAGGVIPAVGGAYGLEIVLAEPVRLRAGRLGEVVAVPGTWRYFGSAYGPGGLRARVGRHLRPEGRTSRWQIDRLTAVAPVRRVLLVPGGAECHLVEIHLAAGWRPLIPGFGSSDCRRCPAHLLWSPTDHGPQRPDAPEPPWSGGPAPGTA